AARIGRKHSIHVGPDVDFLGIEQRTEDRTREVGAVAPESSLYAAAVRGDEAGNDERALEAGGHELRQLGARLIPLHGRAQRSPLDHHAFTRVDPFDLAEAL